MSNIPRMMMLAGASAAASKRFSGLMKIFEGIPDNECAWFDPSDFSTMFQDSAGTVPVTAVGQPVGLMLDKGKGLQVGPELFKEDGVVATGNATFAFTDGVLRVDQQEAGAFGVVFSLPPADRGWYLLSFDIVARSRTGLYAGLQVSGSTIYRSGTSPTRVYEYVCADANTEFKAAYGSGSQTGTWFEIANVSIKRVRGNHAIQTTASARPTLQVDNKGLHYLDFDGVDDTMTVQPNVLLGTNPFVGVGALLVSPRTSNWPSYAAFKDLTLGTGTTSNRLGLYTNLGDTNQNYQAHRIIRGQPSVSNFFATSVGPSANTPFTLWCSVGKCAGVSSSAEDTTSGSSLEMPTGGATLLLGNSTNTDGRPRIRLYQFIWTNKPLTDQQLDNAKKFLAAKTYAPFNMLDLFQGSEEGVWYDPSDRSSLFQDSEGTIPVTEFGQPVGLMLDKSPNANHAIQATATRRPIYTRVPAGGVRNYLAYSNGQGWTQEVGSFVLTPNAAQAPDGSMTASRLQRLSAPGYYNYRLSGLSGTGVATHSLWVKRGPTTPEGATFRLMAWRYGQSPQLVLGQYVTLTDEWQRVVFTFEYAGSSDVSFMVHAGGRNPNDLYIWGGQQEAGSTATENQISLGRYDVTEAGVPDIYGLTFDGVDDVMQTSRSYKINGDSGLSMYVGEISEKIDANQAILASGSSERPNIFSRNTANFRSGFSNSNPSAFAALTGRPTNTVISALTVKSPGMLTNTLRSNRDSVTIEIVEGVTNNINLPQYLGGYSQVSNRFNGLVTGVLSVSRSTTLEETTLIENYINKNTRAF